MKLASSIICAFILIGVLCYKTFGANGDVGHGIQILSPNTSSFVLDMNELQKILESENIKDRYVMVFSIAGAFRQGKSFLLNFFLKYLEAQYKKHDISDWLGENDEKTTLTGFEWATGRKRKTVGILMWSEIFTHDFANGDKVAIILLDTQGIFDDQTSLKECSTIFALSTIISSIQGYNIMRQIQEDHLQHLQLFTEYGRLALQHTNEKPFQKLLFIVRDWPFADEINYGWDNQTLINELVNGNDKQTSGMQQLRNELTSSFDEIRAFLLPYPGPYVARKKEFNGSLKQIDPEFIIYAKQLAQDLFNPNNLIIKKINGQKVRARDLVQYFQEYMNVFNGDALPEPQPIYEATAKVHNSILSNDCVKSYNDFMEKQFNEVYPYLKQNDLDELHHKAKTNAIMKFNKTLKLGNETLINVYRSKIDKDIEQKFITFHQKNEEKRNMFIEKAKLHNEQISIELKEKFKKAFFVEDKCFDARKMGDNEISGGMREKFESDLNDFVSMVNTALGVYNDCANEYIVSMRRSIEEAEKYFKYNELIKLHEQMTEKLNSKIENKLVAIDEKLALIFQRKLNQQLVEQFSSFTLKNEEKHQQFIKRASDHNEKLMLELKDTIRIRVIGEINKLQAKFDEKGFSTVLSNSIAAAMQEFDAKKLDDGEVASDVRRKLSKELETIEFKLSNTVHSYNHYFDKYIDWMQDALRNESAFFKMDALQELHNKTKTEAITQKSVRLLNEALVNQTFSDAQSEVNKTEARIPESGRDHAYMDFICNNITETALSNFDAKKKGDDEISTSYRQILQTRLGELESKLRARNEEIVARYEQYLSDKRGRTRFFALMCGAFGTVFGLATGGPPGAIAGAGLCGTTSNVLP